MKIPVTVSQVNVKTKNVDVILEAIKGKKNPLVWG